MIIKNAFAILLSCVLFTTSYNPTSAQSLINNSSNPTIQRLTVEGNKILLPNGNPIELRGLNWGWWDTAQSQDAKEAVVMNANVIRMPIRWYFTGDKSDIRDTKSPGHISPEGLKQLDQYIDWCAEQKLWVVLFAGSDQGAGDNSQNYWTNPELRKEFLEMWEFIVDRYKDKPYIGAYEILSEPHPKKPATSKDLLQFYEQAIKVIRNHDKKTPVMIGANDHYDINLLEGIYTKIDPNVIYTFNYYLPTEYCKTDKQREKGLPLITYPGTYKDKYGKTIYLNKDYLSIILQPALAFRDKYNVPVFVNQVGVRSEAPGHLQYINDVMDIFYQNHIPFTYWTYRTRSDESQHGLYWLDKSNVYHPKNEQIELLKKAFQRK